MNAKRIALIMLLITSIAAGRPRPPVLDPNAPTVPYDPNILQVAEPVAWLPADVNVSVVSQINVWNRQGRTVVVAIEEIIVLNGEAIIQPIPHMMQADYPAPMPDPNGGYNQAFTWGFTPSEPGLTYLLFTATTPEKPQWQSDSRIFVIYVEAEDPPIIWAQDVPLLTTHHAKRLWQASVKVGTQMTKPTLVRLSRSE
jgi:hypothetical protein